MRKKLFAVTFACALALSVAIPALAAPEPKVDICHNGQTINVALIAGHHHLLQHEGDTVGLCGNGG